MRHARPPARAIEVEAAAMRTALTFALLAILSTSSTAQVYECPGKDGPEFTDVPCTGGRQLQLPPPSVIETERPRAAPPAPAEPAATGYAAFAIASPEEQGTVHTNTGRFPVALSLDPALRDGDLIQVSLDGTLLAKLRDSLQFDIAMDEWESAAVADAQHVLEAHVLDRSGKTVISAAPVQFYVLRSTVKPRGR
jgi:hypothetical protein